uniref:Fn3_5 domain-containing protein n=1 Tax=Caenorhabditis tropicalis TaxID=1561998 RepID=A0A1I7UEA0_9PELO
MIANSSSKSSLQFSLQPPSDYNKYEQIEYTVSVSGAYKTPFDAQFVYDPKENVLKSGKIASCPATRSRGFY